MAKRSELNKHFMRKAAGYAVLGTAAAVALAMMLEYDSEEQGFKNSATISASDDDYMTMLSQDVIYVHDGASYYYFDFKNRIAAIFTEGMPDRYAFAFSELDMPDKIEKARSGGCDIAENLLAAVNAQQIGGIKNWDYDWSDQEKMAIAFRENYCSLKPGG